MDIQRIRSAPKLPRRNPDGHKGTYGHVLVVGGSRGMIGAVALAANAALRGGAGMVTFAAPHTVQLAIAPLCPCATSVPLACKADGQLAADSVRQTLQWAQQCDVLAVGPGLAVGAVQKNLLLAVLEQARPAVIDADALNNLAALKGWPALRRCALVLTPHPGEFARLTSKTVEAVQAGREEAALAAAGDWAAQGPKDLPLVLVLKGHGTVVTDGRRIYLNATGNPGMATGGTGDVLTGLTAALIGQGLTPFDAACLAVHCHGRAGDLAAKTLGEVSLTAWDLLDYLPAAMMEAVAGPRGHKNRSSIS